MLQTDYVIGSPLNHQDPFIQRHGSKLTANELPPFRQPFTSRRGIRLAYSFPEPARGCVKELKKIIARTLCFMHQRIFRPIYIFNNYAYFLDFRAQKFPLIFFNLNPFQHQQALHFGVSNYENNIKKAPVKFWEDLLYFQHFMQIFVFAPN